ncbi:MAG: hypothetical protein PVH22_11035, partial [Desulfobacteraceae bacterium]
NLHAAYGLLTEIPTLLIGGGEIVDKNMHITHYAPWGNCNSSATVAVLPGGGGYPSAGMGIVHW